MNGFVFSKMFIIYCGTSVVREGSRVTGVVVVGAEHVDVCLVLPELLHNNNNQKKK